MVKVMGMKELTEEQVRMAKRLARFLKFVGFEGSVDQQEDKIVFEVTSDKVSEVEVFIKGWKLKFNTGGRMYYSYANNWVEFILADGQETLFCNLDIRVDINGNHAEGSIWFTTESMMCEKESPYERFRARPV